MMGLTALYTFIFASRCIRLPTAVTHRACVEVISASILTEWLCGWVRVYK